MKRGRIGDVYAIKVPNGYKLYQRAYDIPRKGRYIRVFDGLYDTIPDHVEAIVLGPHSYVTTFDSNRAYRIGLAQLVGNYKVPEEYPFPEYMFDFRQNANGKIISISVVQTDIRGLQSFRVSRMEDLPTEFQELKLLWPTVTPNWLLYLFDINWSPLNLSPFFPGRPGDDFAAILQPYTDIINAAQEKSNEHL